MHSVPLEHDTLPCSDKATVKAVVYHPGRYPHANYDEAVQQYEVWLIKHALRRANGSIARAAVLMGMIRQSLEYIIDGRLAFANLRTKPRRHRRRSIIKKTAKKRKAKK